MTAGPSRGWSAIDRADAGPIRLGSDQSPANLAADPENRLSGVTLRGGSTPKKFATPSLAAAGQLDLSRPQGSAGEELTGHRIDE